MEKQKMEEKTMEENNKKNPDSERKSKLLSAVLMAFVCILMMGGGTYAWFTMGNTAKVNSLKLNVASEGSLYIATEPNKAAGDKKASAEWLNMTEVRTLYPCTSTNGETMQKPVYESETSVKSAADFANSKEKELYVLEKDFYLYMDDSNAKATYNVSLGQNNSSDAGSYIKTENASGVSYFPEACVRVSFQVGDQEVAVWEPNSDVSNGGMYGKDYATDAIAAPTITTHKQSKTTGLFTSNNDADKAPIAGDSDKLFTITGSTDTPVKVRVWFEGTDTDCRNQIELKNMVGQLKFVANKQAVTAP